MVHYQGTVEDISRIKIHSRWPEQESVAVCHQCLNPRCIEAYPTEAIQQVNGIIRLDQEKCTQCYLCFASPFHAGVIEQLSYPSFCDTCDGRYEYAQMCPTKALKRGGKQ